MRVENGKRRTRDAGLRTALALATVPVAAQGLSRFAYALLLPTMQRDLGWSFATAGSLNTANGVGYLIGALAAVILTRRLGVRKVLRLSLVGLVVTLAGCAATSAVAPLLVLRALSGVCAATSFVVGAAMVTHLGARTPSRSALLVGLYFGGVGVGVGLSALVVPSLGAVLPADGAAWRVGWLGLAGAALPTLLVVWLVTRRRHEVEVPAQGSAASLRPIIPFLVSYTLFGLGYIGYMTFVVSFVTMNGVGAAPFWLTLGVAGAVGPVVLPSLVARWPPAVGVAVLVVATAAGAALPLLAAGAITAYLSAVLFGVSFLAAMSAFTSGARQVLPSSMWTGAVATLTCGFAIGQALGPTATGLAADLEGLHVGLSAVVAVLLLSAVVASVQRPTQLHPAAPPGG